MRGTRNRFHDAARMNWKILDFFAKTYCKIARNMVYYFLYVRGYIMPRAAISNSPLRSSARMFQF